MFLKNIRWATTSRRSGPGAECRPISCQRTEEEELARRPKSVAAPMRILQALVILVLALAFALALALVLWYSSSRQQVQSVDPYPAKDSEGASSARPKSVARVCSSRQIPPPPCSTYDCKYTDRGGMCKYCMNPTPHILSRLV